MLTIPVAVNPTEGSAVSSKESGLAPESIVENAVLEPGWLQRGLLRGSLQGFLRGFLRGTSMSVMLTIQLTVYALCSENSICDSEVD